MEPARGAPRSARRVYDLLAQAQREGFTRLGAPRRLGGVPASRARRAARARGAGHRRRGPRRADRRRPRTVPLGRRRCGRAVARRPASRCPYLSAARTDWIGCCALAGPMGRGARDARVRGGWMLVRRDRRRCPPGAIATHALIRLRRRRKGCRRPRGGAARSPRASSACRPGTSVGLRALCSARIVLDRVHDAARPPHRGEGGHAARRRRECTRTPRAPCWRSASAGPPTRDAAVGARGGVGRPSGVRRAERCCRTCTGMYRLHRRRPRARPRDLPAERRPLPGRRGRLRPSCPCRPGASPPRPRSRSRERRCGCAAGLDARGVAFLDGSAFDPAKLLRDARAAHHDPKEKPHGPRQDA